MLCALTCGLVFKDSRWQELGQEYECLKSLVCFQMIQNRRMGVAMSSQAVLECALQPLLKAPLASLGEVKPEISPISHPT
jgi:hypothetical protein